VVGNASEEVLKVIGPDGREKIRQETEKNYRRYERLGNRVLGNFVEFLKVY